MQKICEGYALSSGSEIELRIKYMYPSIIHDEALLNKVLPAISDRFMLAKKNHVSRRISHITRKNYLHSLCYLASIKMKDPYPLHSDHFNFDEEILTVGHRSLPENIKIIFHQHPEVGMVLKDTVNFVQIPLF